MYFIPCIATNSFTIFPILYNNSITKCFTRREHYNSFFSFRSKFSYFFQTIVQIIRFPNNILVNYIYVSYWSSFRVFPCQARTSVLIRFRSIDYMHLVRHGSYHLFLNKLLFLHPMGEHIISALSCLHVFL